MKRNTACTDGSSATRAKAGSIVKLADPADVRMPRKVATLPAVRPRQCAIRPHEKRRVPLALAGRTEKVWVEGLDSRVKFNRIVICLSDET